MTILLLLILVLAGAGPARAQVEDLPCVLCHPSRDLTAYQLLGKVPGVLLGQESGQARVCLSCHNGTVVDDRQRLLRGGQHPTGVPAGVLSPAGLPLYGVRTLECGTCHSPHGEGPLAQRWLRLDDADGGLCIECHPRHDDLHLRLPLLPAQSEQVRRLGGRLLAGDRVQCTTCHNVHGARAQKLLIAPYGAQEDQLCRTCHPALSVKGALAGAAGAPCADCHAPHSVEPQQLRGQEEGPCLRCHPQRQGEREHPRYSASCAGCHSIHRPVRPDGSASGLLRMPTAQGLLCVNCHGADRGAHGQQVAVREQDAALLTARGLPRQGDGSASCRTCHRAHAARDAALLRVPRGILCLYCHKEENPFGAQGLKGDVHPVAVHLQGEQQRELVVEGGQAGAYGELVCTSCHGAHQQRADTRLRCVVCHPEQDTAGGHDGSGECALCHSIHGGEQAPLDCRRCHARSGDGLHPEALPLAAGALPPVAANGRLVAVGTLDCVTCHDPHGAEAPFLRRGAAQDTCLACHGDKGAMGGSSHDVAAGGSVCTPCHPVHAAGGPGAADAAATADAEDPVAARCQQCHADERHLFPGHSPRGAPPWSVSEGGLPLFDAAGKRNDYGFVSCPTCHDVHRPAAQRSMRMEERDPPDLCLHCHRQKQTLLGTAHDPRGSEGGAACTACHEMHPPASTPRFWNLREESQGTWNDRKCSPCHGPPNDGPRPHGGPLSHPVNVLLPGRMKTGGLPLFDALGGGLGRALTCSTCHNLHGSVSGSGAVLPKFLRRNPGDGELCSGCHPGHLAVRGTAHDFVRQGARELGPCSPCHTVHQARAERSLWGLEPAPGEYQPNRLCRSCHRQDGPVPGEFLLLQYHMKDAEELLTSRGTIYLQRSMLLLDEWALKMGNEPVVPLYDRAGNPGPDGNLQCVSCHNPHQWSPMGGFVKPGFGTLGPNVPRHFLRLNDDKLVRRSVCGVCHPSDAVKRYREYHYVWHDVGDEFR